IRPHAHAGCRAHPPRPGVRGIRADDQASPCPDRGRGGRTAGAEHRGDGSGHGLERRARVHRACRQEPRRADRFELRTAEQLVHPTQSMAPMLAVSASLRGLAVDLAKIAEDLLLMSSGPRTGFAEIRLPARQPGSSIMPGKVNPVMVENISMIS